MGKVINFTSTECFKSNSKYQPKYHPKYHPKGQSQFTSLFIFGDSLSDVGNLSTFTYLGSGGQFWFPPSPPLTLPPPFGGPYSSLSPYYNSQSNPLAPPQVRASNGKVWADIFPSYLGLSPAKVTNYAYSGATSGFSNGLQPFLPKPLDTMLPLPGLLTEIDNFKINTKKADPKALYVVWASANDGFNLAGLLASQPLPDLRVTFPIITSAVKNAVDNITTAITTLANKGAHTFLIPNLPDLGKTPLLSVTKESAFVGKAFSLLFDIALAIKLPRLERALDIDIVQPDVYSLAEDIFNRPQEYGLKNVTTPLIMQNPLDPNVKPDEFFWYDYQHPTAKGHEIIAEFFKYNLFSSGYGDRESTNNLPQLGGSPLIKDALELALGSGLSKAVSDLKVFGLEKELSALIPSQFFPFPEQKLMATA